MNEIEKIILETAEKIDPNAPILQAIEAATETLADPSPTTILHDIETLQTILSEFKAKLKGVHPSLINLFKALF